MYSNFSKYLLITFTIIYILTLITMNIDLKRTLRRVLMDSGVVMILIITFPLLLSNSSRSQPVKICAQASLAEKIYLQLDGKTYTTNDIIWFKAIVVHALNHAPSKLSRILYVELISSDERILEKKLIRLEEGIGEGFFELNQVKTEGIYLIRAYTEWNKNFGTDFIFTAYIHVFAPPSIIKSEPIGDISLIKEQNNLRRLKFSIDPFSIDNLHKKDLKLCLTLDDRKDTISIPKNKDNKYLVDYQIPEKCQFVTLQFLTQNQFSYSKTIALNEDYFDLQFFPESGELVDGLRSKVGFKALDYNGKGKFVEGEIVSAEGEIMTHFKSNTLGMGSFVLSRVDGKTTYFARLSTSSNKGLSVTYPMPAISRKGNVLSVFKSGEEILVRTLSNYLKNDSIFLLVSCRGVLNYALKAGLKEGVFSVEIPRKKLPEGIIAFTMADSLMQPLAERLYFNDKPESRINISLASDKDKYNPREMTRLTIATKSDSGKAINANLSVLVLNKNQLGEMQGDRQNILSCFLLTSDLKGEIENPGYYFRKDSDKFNDLDALLLTQGWRKYLFTKPPDKMEVQPETFLSVSGTVSGLVFAKRKKVADLTLMTFGRNKTIHMQKTDSLGRFLFNLNDEYGQKLNVLIQSVNKAGKNWDYTISLDKKDSPDISFNHVRTIQKIDNVELAFSKNNIEKEKAEENFRFSKEGILLNEVVVDGQRLNPARKRMIDQCGKPSEIINGEDIVAKEEKWSYGLYSVLMFHFSSIMKIEVSSEGTPVARVRNSSRTLIMVDGIPLQLYEYESIPYMSPGDIKFIDIYENAKIFPQVFAMTYPGTSAFDIPTIGNVIAVYTKVGRGIYGTQQTTGIVKASVPVFSAPREFYAPKYENSQSPASSKPDLRSLVHWEPMLRSDSTGKASAAFYNADIAGEMLVVVEAISASGEIGYKELVYRITFSRIAESSLQTPPR